MTRTFSSPSESLGYFIGFALLHYERIALVSPWISDIEVTFPVNNRDVDAQQLYLSEALEEFTDDTEITLYIRGGQTHNNYIQDRLGGRIEIQLIDDLHAKAVVTPELVYVGSANLTRSGLHINRELCQIVENDYDSVDDYIQSELEL